MAWLVLSLCLCHLLLFDDDHNHDEDNANNANAKDNHKDNYNKGNNEKLETTTTMATILKTFFPSSSFLVLVLLYANFERWIGLPYAGFINKYYIILSKGRKTLHFIGFLTDPV